MSISNLTLSLSRFCCFLWYGVAQKGFRFYHLKSHRLMVSHPVVFKEYNLFKMKSKFCPPTFPLFSPVPVPSAELVPRQKCRNFWVFYGSEQSFLFQWETTSNCHFYKKETIISTCFLFEYIIINFQKLDRTSKMAKRVL